MNIYTDYLIAVYYNGEVRKLSYSNETIPQNTDVRFIIHCEFDSTSYSGQTPYYKNKLYDNSNQRISDNTFNWEGMLCKIDDKVESWGSIDAICLPLRVDVTDKLNIKKEIKFENISHDGWAFKELFIYLNNLLIFSTHKSLENAYDIIAKKDSQIKQLEAISLLNLLIVKIPIGITFTIDDIVDNMKYDPSLLKLSEKILQSEGFIKCIKVESVKSFSKFIYQLTEKGNLLKKSGSYEVFKWAQTTSAHS